MMASPREDVVKGTVFNSSLECLARLGDALRECNYYSKMAKTNGLHVAYLKLWHDTLFQDAYQEISPVISEDENTKLYNMFVTYRKLKSCVKVIQNPLYSTSQVIITREAFIKKWFANHTIENAMRKLATKYKLLLTKKEFEDDEPEYW